MDSACRAFQFTPAALAIPVVVGVGALCAHWPVLSSQARCFDDGQYLSENALVNRPGFASAWRFFSEVLRPSTVEGYYQPLAMLSLMADCAMGGGTDDPRVFHRTALALHVINSVLSAWLVYALFGRALVAALVGLLFAMHPMTVEPVAWISERKTLLAYLFSMAAVLCHVRYARAAGPRTGRAGPWLQAGTPVCYLLACLSKPTAMALPLVLLVLDYWPLGRFSRRAVIEKLPLFVMGGLFVVITLMSQGRGGGINAASGGGIPERLVRAAYLPGFYVRKLVWPTGLTPVYEMPAPMSVGNPDVAWTCVGVLAAVVVSLISLRWTRAVAAGTTVFVILVFPTLGIVQYSWLAASDKYAYLPSLGLVLVLGAMGAQLLSAGGAGRRFRFVACCVPLVIAEGMAARRAYSNWRDTRTLYENMAELAPRSAEVRNMLGRELLAGGRVEEATQRFEEALKLRPTFADAEVNMALALASQGRSQEAEERLERAAASVAGNPRALFNLAYTWAAIGRHERAIEAYGRLLERNPRDAMARLNRAGSLLAIGRWGEAIHEYNEALTLRPNDAGGHYQLGRALLAKGELASGLTHWRQAAALAPGDVMVLNNLAWVLSSAEDARIRNGPEAVSWAESAAALTDCREPTVLATLANAYSEAGRFAEAVDVGRLVVKMRSSGGDEAALGEAEERLALYESGRAHVEAIRAEDYLPMARNDPTSAPSKGVP